MSYAMPSAPTSVLIRCTTDPTDVALAAKLRKQLRPSERNLDIEVWEGHVAGSHDRHEETERRLRTANVVLLLISSDYYDSDYLYGFERPILMERQKSGSLMVIPIILRACTWEDDSWISGLRPLPSPRGRPPIIECDDRSRDAVLKNIVLEARRRIDNRHNPQPATRTQLKLAEDSYALFRTNKDGQVGAVKQFLERCMKHLSEEYGHSLRFAAPPPHVYADDDSPWYCRAFHVHVELDEDEHYPSVIKVWYGNIPGANARSELRFATGETFENAIDADFSDACLDAAANMLWKAFQGANKWKRSRR